MVNELICASDGGVVEAARVVVPGTAIVWSPAGPLVYRVKAGEAGETAAAAPVEILSNRGDEVVLTSGSGSFTKSNINVAVDVAQGLVSGTNGFYFNVHSTTNAGGVARGQLVKQ